MTSKQNITPADVKNATVTKTHESEGATDTEVITVELQQSVVTKVKSFFQQNRKFFVGTVTGLVFGVVLKVAKDQIAAQQADETVEPAPEA
jgi:hypothetical protein